MSAFRVQDLAGRQLDEIYAYSENRWGEAQARAYIRGLFERFEAIAARRVPWRAIPATLGVDGWFCRYQKHFIYWKVLANGDVGIAAILHERMHQGEQLRGLVDDRGD